MKTLLTEVMGPSAISWNEASFPMPQEASLEYIQEVKDAYKDAIHRAKKAGFDYIELHGAHGYFMHEFMSPLSNTRTDQYGGSLENRMRLPVELAELARKEWDGPLFFRISATDWLEKVDGPEKVGDEWKWWGLEQSTILAAKLRDAGVDLLDVSSGGNDNRSKYPVGPGYQVPLAAHIKKNVPNLLIGAVGILTDANQCEDILETGQADVCFFAREALRNIDFPLKTAEHFDVAVAPAPQYERAWGRMLKPIHS